MDWAVLSSFWAQRGPSCPCFYSMSTSTYMRYWDQISHLYFDSFVKFLSIQFVIHPLCKAKIKCCIHVFAHLHLHDYICANTFAQSLWQIPICRFSIGPNLKSVCIGLTMTCNCTLCALCVTLQPGFKEFMKLLSHHVLCLLFCLNFWGTIMLLWK